MGFSWFRIKRKQIKNPVKFADQQDLEDYGQNQADRPRNNPIRYAAIYNMIHCGCVIVASVWKVGNSR
jgi:hypothetical protein